MAGSHTLIVIIEVIHTNHRKCCNNGSMGLLVPLKLEKWTSNLNYLHDLTAIRPIQGFQLLETWQDPRNTSPIECCLIHKATLLSPPSLIHSMLCTKPTFSYPPTSPLPPLLPQWTHPHCSAHPPDNPIPKRDGRTCVLPSHIQHYQALVSCLCANIFAPNYCGYANLITEMVVTTVSTTVSNIVGMIGTEACLSMQTAAMKVQWCISPINILPMSCQPFPVITFLSTLISLTRQMCCSSQRRTYCMFPWHPMPCLTPWWPCKYSFPLYNTLAIQSVLEPCKSTCCTIQWDMKGVWDMQWEVECHCGGSEAGSVSWGISEGRSWIQHRDHGTMSCWED